MTPIVSTALMRTQSDARLVELARGGSERAFEGIVDRYRRPLSRYLGRLVPQARVEDVLQEVFVKAWRNVNNGTEVSDLRPWLYRIAHNTALNALRKSGYDYVELQDSLRSAYGEPEPEQERRAVVLRTLAGMAALPEAQRQALLRTAVDGASHEDVARELGLSEPAVRGLVYRARATLRAAATALTPPPVLNWLLSAGGSPGGGNPRIAELVAGSASSAGVGIMVKAGALVSAGAIATGAVSLKPLAPDSGGRSASADTQAPRSPAGGNRDALLPGERRALSLRGASDLHGSGRGGRDDSSGPGGHDEGGDDHSGRGSSGSEARDDRSGRSGPDDSTSGSSGSGSDDSTSGSGRSGTGSGDDSLGDDSRSGGSGTSGSGSSGSPSGDGVAPAPDDSTSGTSGGSGSGSSGSGSGSSDDH